MDREVVDGQELDERVTAVPEPDEPDEGADGRAPAVAPVVAVGLTVAAVAIGLTAGPLHRLGLFGSIEVPWLLLAVAFAASEVFLIHLETRREAVSISLSTIPLVVGLYAVAPVLLVVARVLGSALALIGHRRQKPLKLFINLGHMGLEAAVAVLVFRALATPGDLGPSAWGAAMVAAMVSDLVQTLVLVAVLSLYQRRLEVDLGPSMLAGSAARLVDTTLALVLVTMLRAEPVALLLLAPVCGALLLGYRTHGQLREQHRQLEHLHSFARAVGSAVLRERTMESVLRECVDVLHADAAWLLLPSSDGATRWISREPDGTLREELGDEPACWSSRAAGGRARSVVHLDAATEPSLGRLGVEEALIADLSSAGDHLGALLVADRSGDVRRFRREDQRLLTLIANQAAVALANGQLVDRLRTQAEESEYQSLHDALTGLPNRTMFVRSVHDALASNAETGDQLAVLLLDLDGFKDVNDTLGHQHGDELLHDVAARLRNALRRGDTIARLGGDEFAVLLPDVPTTDAAMRVARGLVASLEASFAVADVSVEIAVSVGIAMSPEHGSDPVALLQRADIAMYVAKERLTGAEVYDIDRDGHTPQRLALVGELRQAIADRALRVHYQPQIDLATGEVSGAEALVRWNHPTRGVVAPDEFVGVAERTGLIGPLTTFVVETAIRDCAAWRRRGGPARVSVNLSARNLLQPTLVDEVAELLRRHDLPAEALCLELTETAVMVEPRRTIAVLRRFAAVGITIAIDDFGTGHSSLAYLKSLPVGEIKLDRSFVMSMLDDDTDDAIVCSVVQLARNMHLPVVAEGIESDAIAHRLSAIGCATGQGYGFSPALASGEFEAWASRWRESHEPVRPSILRAAV